MKINEIADLQPQKITWVSLDRGVFTIDEQLYGIDFTTIDKDHFAYYDDTNFPPLDGLGVIIDFGTLASPNSSLSYDPTHVGQARLVLSTVVSGSFEYIKKHGNKLNFISVSSYQDDAGKSRFNIYKYIAMSLKKKLASLGFTNIFVDNSQEIIFITRTNL